MSKLILISLISVFLLSCNAESNKVDEGNTNSKDVVQTEQIGYWKISKVEAVFEEYLDEEDISGYMDHVKLLEEEGFIEFISESTFRGKNGLLDTDEGFYKIENDSLLSIKALGYKKKYKILKRNSDTLIIEDDDVDLVLKITYIKQ